MTIFARRRLQAMLDALAPALSGEKGRDILRRLNDKRTEQALPAEMELALLWTIQSLGDLEIEPSWWGDSRRPDAVTNTLVAGKTAAIEIAAVSDNAISGEEVMDAIAVQICSVADRSLKGSGNYLYFRFAAESGYAQGKYFRRRLAPPGHRLTSEQVAAVEGWIGSGHSKRERLRLLAPGLDVEIEHTERKQVRFHNIFSSMPAETHSLEENPLFELLVRKARQLRGAAPGTIRILFLADIGSTLLRYVGRGGSELDFTHRYVAARQIIHHFLQTRARAVDAVVTFSPRKDFSQFGDRDGLGLKTRRWMVGFFGTAALPEPPEGLNRIAALLPDPHYEGYQARSLFRQGAFSPAGRGQYLGMTIRGNFRENRYSIELPARLLLDLLAGRLSEERFRRELGGANGKSNIFKTWLDKGLTISGAEMAGRDPDEDDDHLILHFSDDAAARPFRLQENDAHDAQAKDQDATA
ncbi:hypothetical protein DAH66_15385 [Sphingomonas koreensis]|uniref:Uncharacterized protein n=1 Tax=Sphingomonas koreensis TaxID=93064 RepID=A0A430G146_9SPHN|nr:hypothetical protein [Sphingomonas koreensis]RSY81073.1 hypothetical protein DAH66_15385 [Sphingomonas koreensis]